MRTTHCCGAAYRVGYRLLGERTAAEDIAAETLARAYSRWSSLTAMHRRGWSPWRRT